MNSVTETIKRGRGRPRQEGAPDAKTRMRALRARARLARGEDLERLPDSGLLEAVRVAYGSKDAVRLRTLMQVMFDRLGIKLPIEAPASAQAVGEIAWLHARVAELDRNTQTLKQMFDEARADAAHQAAESSLLRGQRAAERRS